jgi:hypothetical protein
MEVVVVGGAVRPISQPESEGLGDGTRLGDGVDVGGGIRG